MTNIIPTGSVAIDGLLGGGIRRGMVTDIYGESGVGKSQFCFTVCVNCAKYYSKQPDDGRMLFIDTAGTFRPERISEIAGGRESSNNDVLGKIMYVRALSTYDQTNAIKKIPAINPRLVIIDSVSSLFSDEFTGAARHKAFVKHLHEICLYALTFNCAIIITNMVRSIPIIANSTTTDQHIYYNAPSLKKITIAQAAINSYEQHEFMGTSMSIHAHIRLKLEVVNFQKSVFKATLIQPTRKDQAYFCISSKGISDNNKQNTIHRK